MSDDVQYLWSSTSGTIFNLSEFHLSQDHDLSMVEMQSQVDEGLNFSFPDETLVRIDSTVVHRVDLPEACELRTFFKLSISKDHYDLEGDSVNPLLKADWPRRKRALHRNTPQA